MKEKEIFANLGKNEVFNEKRGGYYLPYNLLMDENEEHIVDLNAFDKNGKHKVFPYIKLNKRWVRWALRHGYKFV